MKQTIAFLHTSPAHISTFDRLLKELAPSVQTRHIVAEAYLDEARLNGVTPDLAERITKRLLDAATEANVVICTCSTIGSVATTADQLSDKPILRVDQPMAERAVMLGKRIVIAATLADTLIPTRTLIEEAALAAKRSVTLNEAVAENAWPFFEQGNMKDYCAAIAEMLRTIAPYCDLVVLAQASMAPAAELCPQVAIPILSSPRLAIENALDYLSIEREK